MDSYDEQLLKLLLDEHPSWVNHLVTVGARPGSTNSTKIELQIPSEHPTILDPLRLQLWGNNDLNWYTNYFYDFAGDSSCEAAEFLRRFMNEEIQCVTCWQNGKVTAGGPLDGVRWTLIPEGYERIEIRSWRGTYDRDLP